MVEIGFFYIRNTRVDPGNIDRMHRAAQDFFRLSVEQKSEVGSQRSFQQSCGVCICCSAVVLGFVGFGLLHCQLTFGWAADVEFLHVDLKHHGRFPNVTCLPQPYLFPGKSSLFQFRVLSVVALFDLVGLTLFYLRHSRILSIFTNSSILRTPGIRIANRWHLISVHMNQNFLFLVTCVC